MARVLAPPRSVGEKFTVDMQVGDGADATHSYVIVTASGKHIVSHNTVSLIAGATPGVHWPISRYYIRRVRLMNQSELLGPLRAAGYKIEPAFGSEKTTVVVEFPIALGEQVKTQSEVSIWQKVALTEFIQKHWADNQVSVTIDFDRDTEASEIEAILNYSQYNLKSISFLPRSAGSYAQMPYEAITKEQYEALAANLKPLVFDGKKSIDSEKEIDVFCDGDTCVAGGPKSH